MKTGILNRLTRRSGSLNACALGLLMLLGGVSEAQAQTNPPAATAPKTPPAVGTIKSISGNALTLTTDTGKELNVQLPAEVKVFRVPPGAKDLKEAVAIQLNDLQTGDRILVRGKQADDGNSFVASAVVAMKKTDIAEKRATEREEWQRHGIGGLVKSVDAPDGTILISTLTATGPKDVVIHAGAKTVLRRYAPGSVNFDDAKVAPIGEVKAGDQLRARGSRSPDGSEFTADEIVSGSFRNIAGAVQSVDASSGKLSVSDLATKKTVELKVTPESQLRKLPQPIAQRIAMRFKGGGAEGNGTNGTAGSGAQALGASATGGQGGTGAQAAAGNGAGSGGMGGAQRGGGDVQQTLSRLPASSLSDFQKGDVVMLVATSGSDNGQLTVITLLGGVEPILQASTQASSILTPWSLNAGEGGEGGTP
jgi:Cu/Ag efflux protein CusF